MTFDSSADLETWLETAEKIVNYLKINENSAEIAKVQPVKADQDYKLVHFDGEVLTVGNARIMLVNKVKTEKLVRKFWEASEHFLTKEQAINQVYNGQNSDSPRMRHSNDRRLTKLMSRAREVLNKGCRSVPHSIEWFYFDKQRRGYHLYRVSLQRIET